jgi:hypothetical protein
VVSFEHAGVEYASAEANESLGRVVAVLPFEYVDRS